MKKGVWLKSDLWGDMREEMVPELLAVEPLELPLAAAEEEVITLVSICCARCCVC